MAGEIPWEAGPDLVGTRLGKYELQSELGRGGMGTVYRGYDPVLDRSVAVKVLAPHLVWEREFVERFFREARAAARLDHPNIVAIYDVGQEAGWYYFVMKYLEGQPLTRVMHALGRMSGEQALELLRPLAEALDYAHGRGLVHRDVKPANVIVGPSGQLTLTDFGIAQAGQGTRLTRDGTVIGTPEYMSPEQAQGRAVDASSDQYALGVMAYQMLAGRVPFEGESTPALLYRVVHEQVPPLREARPDLPVEATVALERALAKEPYQRYASCTAFVDALATALQPRPIPERRTSPAGTPEVIRHGPRPGKPSRPATDGRPAPARASRRGIPGWVWAVAGLAAVALIAWGVASLGGGAETGSVAEDVRTPVVTDVLAVMPTRTAVPAVTPDPSQTPRPSPTATFEPSLPPAEVALGDTLTRPSDGMTMVYVPAGEFEMGSTEGEEDNQPVHTVVLDGFYIDRMEVTVAQFREFAEATGRATTAELEGTGTAFDESSGAWDEIAGANWEHPRGPESQAEADHPVVQVSWDDASAYCEWSGAQLPTEAQWEYAARGPEERRYPWGDTFDGARLNWCDANCPFDWKNTAYDDGYEFTAPVGTYPSGASWCGALDLAGNVWEWTADWYGDYPSGRQTNPTGPSSGTTRVLRGGSWVYNQRFVRATYRTKYTPGYRSSFAGFRCVVLPGR